VTAEFATVAPAVVLVLAFCLAGMQLSAQQLRLQDAAATAARSVARGDSAGPASGLVPGARLTIVQRGDLVCVTASTQGSPASGLLAALSVSASSCALDGGR
jgi:hypothetical protein